MTLLVHSTPKQAMSIPHPSVAATPELKSSVGVALQRTGLVAAGIATVIWAIRTPTLQKVDGGFSTPWSLALAIGIALVLTGLTSGSAWGLAGRWSALGMIGQAASLQLIDAGPLLHYQHYRLETLFIRPLLVFLGLVAVQAIIVLVAIGPRLKQIFRWLLSRFGARRVLLILAVAFGFVASLSRDPKSFVAETIFAALIAAVNLGNIILAIWAIPDSSMLRLDKVCTLIFNSEGPVQLDRFALSAALFTMLATGLLSYFVYQHTPHIPDEVAYVLHARYLAHGAIDMPSTPVPDAFNIYLMTYEKTRWFSCVPPGWPAMLALGFAAGIPWLVNPILAGINVLLAYVVLGSIYSNRSARLGIILLAVSPWQLFMSMNLMTHTFSFTCFLVAALAVVRARDSGRLIWALLTGVALGIGTLVRPLDGAVVALLVGLWAIGIGSQRLKHAQLAVLGVSTLLVGALILPYNKALTGNAFHAPLMAYMDAMFGKGSNDLGFGSNRGFGWQLDAFPGHTPQESLLNDALNLFSLNTELLGWSVGSLLLVAIGVFGSRLRRQDWAMLVAIAAVLAAYSLYWFNGGPDFGARYWYLILLPCIALAVRGIENLERALGQHSLRALIAVLVLSTFSLATYVPWRAVDKYYHYLRMRPDAYSLIHQYELGDQDLVLVQGQNRPDYASAAVFNPMDVRSEGPVFAWDRDPDVHQQLLAAYPGRRVWIAQGPTLTGHGYRMSGPIGGGNAPDGGSYVQAEHPGAVRDK